MGEQQTTAPTSDQAEASDSAAGSAAETTVDAAGQDIAGQDAAAEATAEMAAAAETTPAQPDAASHDAAGPAGTAKPTDNQSTGGTITNEMQIKLDEYVGLLQRSRAEFANYKKRTDRELTESRQKGALEALAQVLPIIDDFERAMGSIPAELQGNPWMNGVSLLLKKFEKLLTEHDITIIDAVGQPFDPTLHEAIGMEESDTIASGHVTITLQKGYISGDKVLRPALVKVAS